MSTPAGIFKRASCGRFKAHTTTSSLECNHQLGSRRNGRSLLTAQWEKYRKLEHVGVTIVRNRRRVTIPGHSLDALNSSFAQSTSLRCRIQAIVHGFLGSPQNIWEPRQTCIPLVYATLLLGHGLEESHSHMWSTESYSTTNQEQVTVRERTTTAFSVSTLRQVSLLHRKLSML